jgi:hypothetical protein
MSEPVVYLSFYPLSNLIHAVLLFCLCDLLLWVCRAVGLVVATTARGYLSQSVNGEDKRHSDHRYTWKKFSSLPAAKRAPGLGQNLSPACVSALTHPISPISSQPWRPGELPSHRWCGVSPGFPSLLSSRNPMRSAARLRGPPKPGHPSPSPLGGWPPSNGKSPMSISVCRLRYSIDVAEQSSDRF